MKGPDVAGLLAELARVTTDPAKRAHYRTARSAVTTAAALRRGSRYRTRSLPRAYAQPRQPQPRDPITGRFVSLTS